MVVRYGLAGLGLGVAGVVVYRLMQRRGAKVESIARTAAHNLAGAARSVANEGVSKSARKGRDSVKPLKKKHLKHSRVR